MSRRTRTRRRRRITYTAVSAAVAVGLVITGGGAGAVIAVVYLVSIFWGLVIAGCINVVLYPRRGRHYRPLEPVNYTGPGSWSPFVAIPDD
jgi:hypothetical protein